MPLPRIYIETSVISYLTSRPSRDLVIAARQEITSEWWEKRGTSFEALTSNLVLKEIAAGNAEAAMRRLVICQPLPRLTVGAARHPRRIMEDTAMTNPAVQLLPIESPRPRLGRNDPILQELWAVKAAMSAEADYSIAKLAEQARQFDLEATIAHLKREAGHTAI